MDQPALYMVAHEMQRRDADDFTDEYGDEIRKMSGRCLDIGSGPGDVTIDVILPRLNPDATIVCSDISEPMLNYGKEKYRDNSRLSFVKLDIESRDLPEDLIEQFDHITSFYCLHWCQNMRRGKLIVDSPMRIETYSFILDLRQAFENIYNLLRPEGTAFLVFISNDSGFNAYEVLAAMPRYQPYMKDVGRYIPAFQHTERKRETLKSLVKDVGFDVRHCSLRERSYVFNTPDILSKYILAVNPFIERMPVDLREEYKKDLIREIAKQKIIFNKNNNKEDDYSILSRYYVFIVYLRKPLAK